ncbi:hypothetical protein RKD23_005338 [Streptomyces sp. SAI-170]
MTVKERRVVTRALGILLLSGTLGILGSVTGTNPFGDTGPARDVITVADDKWDTGRPD